jgi:hypothetical protein
MMIETAKSLVENYSAWLRNKTELRQLKDSPTVSISTPFLDRHNDCLEIYVSQQDNGFLLSDDGETIADLAMCGMSFERSQKRQELLKDTLNGFGVRLENGREITISASSIEDFPAKKHNLIQAILAVNDMFYLAEPVVMRVFLEDVTDWLNENRIRTVSGIKIPGISGYDHHFDFVIPKSDQQPERVLRAISWPNRDAAQMMAFAWHDIQRMRPTDARAVAILNDRERAPKNEVYTALRQYDIEALPWSKRADWQPKLAA